MKAALRVLTALSERQEPDQADVDELHWYAPAERDRPIDELVCDAIQRALRDREQSRKAVKASQRRRVLAMNSAELEGLVETAVATSRKERERQIAQLLRDHARRQQEYVEVCARLKRLGIVLQHATPDLLAAESANGAVGSVAGAVDVSGIINLLNDHVRLTRALLSDKQALKDYGIE
jgi:Cdc6-like AAA superfamily ATPase